jgi:hypothetical protein
MNAACWLFASVLPFGSLTMFTTRPIPSTAISPPRLPPLFANRSCFTSSASEANSSRL